MGKRVLCLLLALLVVVGMLPTAFASEVDGPAETVDTTSTEASEETAVPADEADEPTQTVTEATEEATEVTEETSNPPEQKTEPSVEESEEAAITEATQSDADPDAEVNTGILEYGGYSLIDPSYGISFFSNSGTLKWYGMYQIQTRNRSINYFTYTAANGSELSANLRTITRMYMDGTVAYCIRPGWTASDGASYTEDDQISAWQTYLNDAQREAIATVVALGYPMRSFTDGADTGIYASYGDSKSEWQTSERYAATQILIWEFLMGWRSPEYPYTLDTSKTSSSGRTLLATFYSASDSNANWPTLIKVYNEILQAMKDSKQIPSFASETASGASAIKLVKNASTGKYEATVTDTNGVLSDYTFKSSSSGITFTKSGNTLTISATAEAAAAMGASGVLASATGSAITVDPDEAVMVWYAPSGSQSVITPVDAGISSTVAYIKLTADASGSAAMKKTTTASDGDVDGYCFKIYQWGGSSWYGKTDANGDVYVTDSNYFASTKTYTFTGLTDGDYTFLEVLSKKGAGNVFPDSWRITVKNSSGTTVYDKTFTSEISKDANGDARLGTNDAKISITGLSGGGTLTMTINNAPDTGSVKLVKTTSTGTNLDGWQIGLYTDVACTKAISGSPFTTGSDGTITVDSLTPGTYYAREIPVDDPYWVCDDSVKTVTVVSGETATVTFYNQQYGGLKVVKNLDTDGTLEGWQFKITDTGGKEIEGSPFTTDENGVILTGQLLPGTYTVEELLPEDSLYYCKTDNPQTITVEAGKTAEVTFTNALRPGKISVKKVDTSGNRLAGATFCLEWSEDGTTWQPVQYCADSDVAKGGCSNAGIENGCLTTGSDGIVEWGNLHPGLHYRITETEAPNGYQLLVDYAYEGQLPIEDLTVTLRVVNTEIYTLPYTGSSSLNRMAIAQVLCIAMCLGMLVCASRKKKHE